MSARPKTLVSRDPFAREELFRERVYYTKKGCTWCGKPQVSPLGKAPYLFRYTVETDGGRKAPDANLFCSIECRRAYNAH